MDPEDSKDSYALEAEQRSDFFDVVSVCCCFPLRVFLELSSCGKALPVEGGECDGENCTVLSSLFPCTVSLYDLVRSVSLSA